jgi:polysaccharide biosynthesis transport protein
MDIGYLLRILARRKWLILGAMLATAVLTFLLIGLRPEKYKSGVLLATGIVNYKGINSDNSDAFVQQYQIDNAFSNLMEFAQSRSSIKVLTIKMLQHDLNAAGDTKAFRIPKKDLVKYTPEEEKELLAEINKINLDSITELTFSQKFDYQIDKISRAYGYDHEAILRSLEIKRKQSTDYLEVDMVTETPALSQYQADAYVKCFINYYHNLSVHEKRKNVETFAKLAEEKKMVVDSFVDLKFEYLRQKGLPVLGKQSEELVMQIAKLEGDRQRAAARKQASKESVQRLDQYLNDNGTRDANDVKGRILEKNATAEQLERVRELTNRSLEKGGKDAEVEAELAEAKEDLNRAVRSSARTQGKLRTDESKNTKEDLYKEKVNSDLNRISAEEDYSKLNTEIWQLKSRLGTMVVNDEVATKLEADKERALEEFDNVNKELNKAKLALENTEKTLSIIENAQLPEEPEPDRRTLLSIFAAIVIGTLTTIGIFVLAYMDSSVQSPELFSKYSENLPLLGSVAAIPVKGLDLNAVFANNQAQFMPFRESLRKIRTQLLASPGDRVYLFVSAKPLEGKTFNLLSLAHSFAFNNKKVLILDTNFKKPLPEGFTDQPTPNKAFLNKTLRDNGLAEVFQLKSKAAEGDSSEHFVDVLGNSGLPRSPSELFEHEQFSKFLTDLRGHYDFVFLEAAALNQFSDAQELLPYADKVIGVFNASMSIGSSDKEGLAFMKGLNGKFGGAILTQVDEKNL